MSDELKCPKCQGSALSAARTDIPTSQIHKVYVNFKCLGCGAQFDMVDQKE